MGEDWDLGGALSGIDAKAIAYVYRPDYLRELREGMGGLLSCPKDKSSLVSIGYSSASEESDGTKEENYALCPKDRRVYVAAFKFKKYENWEFSDKNLLINICRKPKIVYIGKLSLDLIVELCKENETREEKEFFDGNEKKRKEFFATKTHQDRIIESLEKTDVDYKKLLKVFRKYFD